MKVRIIAGLCVAVATFMTWSKDTARQQDVLGRQTLDESMKIVAGLEKYSANQEWFDSAVERAHDEAFKLAFREGKPRGQWSEATASTLDKEQYLYWFFINLKSEVRLRISNAGARENLSPLKQFQVDIENLRKSLGIKTLPGAG